MLFPYTDLKDEIFVTRGRLWARSMTLSGPLLCKDTEDVPGRFPPNLCREPDREFRCWDGTGDCAVSVLGDSGGRWLSDKLDKVPASTRASSNSTSSLVRVAGTTEAGDTGPVRVCVLWAGVMD